MDFTDKTLVCKDCGKDFVFTAGEQEFYNSKGFANEPTRCKDCRMKNKLQKEDRKTEIVCSNCGKTDTVNFKPRDPNSVLCDDCFRKQRDAVRGNGPMMPESKPMTDSPKKEDESEVKDSDESEKSDESMDSKDDDTKE